MTFMQTKCRPIFHQQSRIAHAPTVHIQMDLDSCHGLEQTAHKAQAEVEKRTHGTPKPSNPPQWGHCWRCSWGWSAPRRKGRWGGRRWTTRGGRCCCGCRWGHCWGGRHTQRATRQRPSRGTTYPPPTHAEKLLRGKVPSPAPGEHILDRQLTEFPTRTFPRWVRKRTCCGGRGGNTRELKWQRCNMGWKVAMCRYIAIQRRTRTHCKTPDAPCDRIRQCKWCRNTWHSVLHPPPLK